MNEDTLAIVNTLNDGVIRPLKAMFVSKDEIIDLLAVTTVAQENLLIVGPPGTAKSAILRNFCLLVKGSFFEYLLTRFTEPNEIFGPIDIKRYQNDGVFERVTERMLPEADIAFLDEVFKANSAILNSLLTVMNERWFFTGREKRKLPLISVFGATNEIPDDEALAALYDRFLVRVRTDNVDEVWFQDLVEQGWHLETLRLQGLEEDLVPVLTTDHLRALYRALTEIDVKSVAPRFQKMVYQIRAEGVPFSDRRVVKTLKVLAASALVHKRPAVTPADFWIFKHVWSTPDQGPYLLREIVQPMLEDWYAEHPEDRLDGRGAGSGIPFERIADEVKVLEKEVSRCGPGTLDTEYLHLLRRLKRLRDAVEAGGGDGADEIDRRIKTLIGATMKRWGSADASRPSGKSGAASRGSAAPEDASR